MKITLTLSMFRDAFTKAGRKNNFSYDGQAVLFKHLTDLEDEIGEDMELDVIALCCDFVEMTLEEVAEDYSVDVDNVMEFLEYHTTLIGSTNKSIIFAQF